MHDHASSETEIAINQIQQQQTPPPPPPPLRRTVEKTEKAGTQEELPEVSAMTKTATVIERDTMDVVTGTQIKTNQAHAAMA